MTDQAWAVVIAAAITALLALIGVVWTAFASVRVSKTAPYGEMVEQVKGLIAWQKDAAPRLTRLERREMLLVQHVHDLRAWVQHGSQGKPPDPNPELHDVLPPDAWPWPHGYEDGGGGVEEP